MAETPDHHQTMLTVMVLMTLVDGKIDDAEVTRIRWIAGELWGRAVSETEVRAAIDDVQARSLGIDTYLADVAPRLSVAAKRGVLRAAFAIACADGRVLDEEDELLVKLARGLAISPEDYRAVLSHMNVARDIS